MTILFDLFYSLSMAKTLTPIEQVAEDFLLALTDAAIAHRYTDTLAKRFQDLLEDEATRFVEDELPQLEEDREGAAHDAYWQGRIDEARGK